jgi:predicted transcriptional regulator
VKITPMHYKPTHGIIQDMEKQTVTFRLDSDKVKALDALASAVDRDRTYLLKEAVEAYLDVQQWQIEHIKAAVRQADSGKFRAHEQVRKLAARRSRAR